MKNKTHVTTGYHYYDTGQITLLNGMVSGYDEGDRIGRQIYMDHMLLRGWRTIYSLSSGQQEISRTMIVYDKSPKGGLPLVSQILEEVNVSSAINWDYRDRFVILYDVTMAMGPWTINGYIQNVGIVEEEEMALALHTEFLGVGGLIGDIGVGALYLLMIGTGTALMGSQYQISIRYSDM